MRNLCCQLWSGAVAEDVREASETGERASLWQLTKVDSTLNTKLQRCANNVLVDDNPFLIYDCAMLPTCIRFTTFWKVNVQGGKPSSSAQCGPFIWQRLGRPRPLAAPFDPSNSWRSQQHFLFLPKVDRVTLTLSLLEATWRTKQQAHK